MSPDPLRDALEELARELQPSGIRLIVGGGYGLLLKATDFAARGVITRDPIPVIRSTADIDWFLGAEIITDPARTDIIKTALNRLGYTPLVPHFQFSREIDRDGIAVTIRVDLLSALIEDDERVQFKDPRIKPRGSHGLQAYATKAAFAVEEQLGVIDVSSDRSGLLVYIPHPFAYLILKLMALRDRLARPGDSRGKYHAFDMYVIVAMSTEEEWDQAEAIRARNHDHPVMPQVRQAFSELFQDAASSGSLALREQARAQGNALSEQQVLAFIADVKELLFGVE